jgi:hypothetical protein
MTASHNVGFGMSAHCAEADLSGIFVMRRCRTGNTTTRCVRNYLRRRMRRYRAPSNGSDTFFADRACADCIADMSGIDLRQA